jgi:hypothetical protein
MVIAAKNDEHVIDLSFPILKTDRSGFVNFHSLQLAACALFGCVDHRIRIQSSKLRRQQQYIVFVAHYNTGGKSRSGKSGNDRCRGSSTTESSCSREQAVNLSSASGHEFFFFFFLLGCRILRHTGAFGADCEKRMRRPRHWQCWQNWLRNGRGGP